MPKPKTIPAVSEDMLAEWRAEGERALADDEGMTTKELCKLWGKSKTPVGKIIRDGLASGRYIEGVAYRENNQSRRKCPVYRLNPDFKEA